MTTGRPAAPLRRAMAGVGTYVTARAGASRVAPLCPRHGEGLRAHVVARDRGCAVASALFAPFMIHDSHELPCVNDFELQL